ncbi:hypothetical protein AHAS_Ahas16G0223200 [Arachis hypogaea]
MARKGRYTKKSKLGPGCQQPQTALPPALASHHDDSQILPTRGDGVPTTSRPFHPPCSEPRPAPRMSINSIHNSEPGHKNLDANVDEVDSFGQEVDDHFVASGAQRRKGCKTTNFWTVKIIGNVFSNFSFFNLS